MVNKKKGMSIKRKLLYSYLSLIILIVIVGAVGIYNIWSVYKNGKEIYVYNLMSVDYLKSISQNVKEIDQCIVGMMSGLDATSHHSYEEDITELQQNNEELMEQYEALNLTNLEKRRYKQCRLSILTFNKQISSIKERINNGESDAALLQYQQELTPAKACTYELLEAVVEMATLQAKKKDDSNQHIFNNIIWIISITIFIAVITAIIITLRMSGYFTSKLLSIQHLAERFSEYNMSDDIFGVENDEFGETMEALNNSQFKMRELLEKIISESGDISNAGAEVSQAVRKSNQRIEEINVKIYDAGAMTEELYLNLSDILENRELNDSTVTVIRQLMDQTTDTRADLEQVQAELSNIAMYLEQVAITSDHQNEIAVGHKQQVEKFKV